MNEQYYLNKGTCSNQIPSRMDDFLNKKNYLAEYSSRNDKEEVLANLGIDQKLKQLKDLIDNKIIEVGGVLWDLFPIEGHTDRVLSSDALYKLLSHYISKNELDDEIRQFWIKLIDKTEEISNNILEEVHSTQGNQNKKLDEYYEQLHTLSVLINSFAESTQGTALSNKFGDSEYLGINQKTLTRAINKIWDKIDELTGESSNSINMTVTPTYFIGENGCTLTITATAIDSNNGIFDKISFYQDNELIGEAEEVDYYTTTSRITGTTEIRCEAWVLGRKFTEIRTITQYNSFWMFTGNFTTPQIENKMNKSNIVPISKNMRGNYNMTFNQDDYLYIIMSEQLAEEFIRADLNGIEIPFEITNILINDTRYRIYKSVNNYNEGTYNIDING